MGYYGLLTPHTAVAKSASGAAWSHGFRYLGDFALPYALYIPLLVLGGWALWTYRSSLCPTRLRSQASITYLLVGAAVLHFVYILRVGGDFMHGRMLLLPLFAMLLPVFVLPLRSAASIGAALFCAVWSVVIILRGHPTDWDTYQGQISIVDERDFWTYIVKREPGDPPRSERDFCPMRQMEAYQEGIDDLEKGDALAVLYAVPREENKYAWKGVAREPAGTSRLLCTSSTWA